MLSVNLLKLSGCVLCLYLYYNYNIITLSRLSTFACILVPYGSYVYLKILLQVSFAICLFNYMYVD